MEDFVPYKLAVKLKEKGYPQDIQHCIRWYPTEYYKNYCIGEYFEGELQEIEDYFGDRISAIYIMENEKKGVIAPTISQVLKWLRDRNIHIEPFLVNAETAQYKLNIVGWNGKFFCSIYNSLLEDANNKTITTYQSYEQAAIAGIEYCLDNLI